MSRKLVNVFENREMRFGFLVLCFALMGHRKSDSRTEPKQTISF
jgi:hypothetical protein